MSLLDRLLDDVRLGMIEAVAVGKEQAQADGHTMGPAVWLESGGVLFLMCHCEDADCGWGVVSRHPQGDR